MRLVALAGGTGSAKLLRGLKAEVGKFTIIANVGDNVWMHGLYVCPDIDIALYTLAGIADTRKGWGVKGDSFRMLEQMFVLGGETWFGLGDRDLALHLLRTEMLNQGRTLTEVTTYLTNALRVKQTILPVTDAPVETHILTPHADLHLQEFWVRRRAKVTVKSIAYKGAKDAFPTREVVAAVEDADKIVVCPANPATSIMPILAVGGMKELLASSPAEKIAVSPMIGNHPFSGPAGKLMLALGYGTDSEGVSRIYSRIIDKIVVDESDGGMRGKIEELGIQCLATGITMSNHSQERRLARFLVEA
jgi:LPPG:FO 2-phospho-L-lactate transferase